MRTIHLTANNTAQERIKAFLEQNASAELAYKINVGTPTEKDGKHLINRKTLDGFMNYARDEARKLAEKGANFACVEEATVYGWAIHYFEEDSIIEKLYNEDGSEYKAETKPKAEPKKPDPTPKKATPTKTAEKPTTPPKAEAPKQTPTPTQKTAQTKPKAPTNTEQMSIFDLF